MATRAERVKEALEHVHGHELVAFALALNTKPLRRDYFNSVCGYDEGVVVRVLAKLANDGVVGETDGLEFHIASKEVAKDVLEHIPEGVAASLHQASLEWAEGREDVSNRFLVDHMIGAGKFAQAGDMALDLRRSEEDPIRAKVWLKPMREALAGLLQAENKNIEQCLNLGLNVVKDGYGLMKPKAVTSILSSLLELELTMEQMAEVTGLEEWLKGERSRARAAAKAKAQAEADAPAQEQSGDNTLPADQTPTQTPEVESQTTQETTP